MEGGRRPGLLRERAAHERRNWVRLNYDCNDRCRFCLDADNHDGSQRSRAEVGADILAGRRRGATRLILSGGEPTIHPDFVDFVRLGIRAGYQTVQTISNGRMFAYEEFLRRSLDAGLGEITLSIHGPNARIHDALVGNKGAFAQTTAGLRAALAVPGLVVNVDVVANRANIAHLPAMLDLFYDWGVREFDILHIVPFGRAYDDGRGRLFYDLDAARPHLARALEFAERPDVQVWFNRFPPAYLEGHEHLIQDPHKLTDEVRGRLTEFTALLGEGVDFDCRVEARCRLCHMAEFCDQLYRLRALLAAGVAEVRISVPAVHPGRDAEPERGDPASSRRPAAVATRAGRPWRFARAGLLAACDRVVVRGDHLGAVSEFLSGLAVEQKIELELRDYRGMAAAVADGVRIARLVAVSAAQVADLLAVRSSAEVVVVLNRDTMAWLEANQPLDARIVLRQPTYARASQAATGDVPLADLARLGPVPVEGLPACMVENPRPRRDYIDLDLVDGGGTVDIFAFTERYIAEYFHVKSLRCRQCVDAASCDGLHVNYVRAHGFAGIRPIGE